MRTTVTNILMHPLAITIMMLAAFMFAAAPARAGGYITPEGGVGGSGSGNSFEEVEAVPTIVDKETLGTNTNTEVSATVAGTTRGIVLSQSSDEITLQTLGGTRTFTINDEAVVKRDGRVVGSANLEKGDIITLSTSRGEVIGINKSTGFFGNVRNILTFSVLSLLIALTATLFYQKFYLERRYQNVGPQRQYLYR